MPAIPLRASSSTQPPAAASGAGSHPISRNACFQGRTPPGAPDAQFTGPAAGVAPALRYAACLGTYLPERLQGRSSNNSQQVQGEIVAWLGIDPRGCGARRPATTNSHNVVVSSHQDADGAPPTPTAHTAKEADRRRIGYCPNARCCDRTYDIDLVPYCEVLSRPAPRYLPLCLTPGYLIRVDYSLEVGPFDRVCETPGRNHRCQDVASRHMCPPVRYGDRPDILPAARSVATIHAIFGDALRSGRIQSEAILLPESRSFLPGAVEEADHQGRDSSGYARHLFCRDSEDRQVLRSRVSSPSEDRLSNSRNINRSPYSRTKSPCHRFKQPRRTPRFRRSRCPEGHDSLSHPKPVLQHAPTHIAQATEFAESQMDSDRAPGGFPGLSSLFQPQASESFGSSVGDQDSFHQQVNSVMQISPSSNNGYGFKTEGSSVYNGIMTAQLGVPVSLSNYGDGPVAIPVGATRGQQGGDGSGSDSQSYTPSAEIYTQSQGSSGQKTQSSSADQYSTYAAAFQAQPTSSGYGQSSSSGTRYSSAPSSDPTIAFYTPQSSSGFGGSPQTYTLSSGGWIRSSKYGPAYSLIGSGNYPTSSSGSYGSSQPSSYSSSSGAYSPSSYGSSASHYTVPTRTYTSSQPSSGYSSSYSSGSPSKYSTSGSAYSSGYGSSSSSSLPSSSVAYDNSQSNYGSYGQRYPSSAYSTSSQSAYSPKRPATNYASTSTSYKNSQAAAAVAQALKAYAAGNVKYGSTKTSSPNTDSSYSTSYSAEVTLEAAGSKTSSKSSYDQRTVGQTLRVSGDSTNSSDAYTTSTRNTSSTPSKSSTV
ncbi:hypothetical protein MRX96_029691 [Rhipicephalus microplus]